MGRLDRAKRKTSIETPPPQRASAHKKEIFFSFYYYFYFFLYFCIRSRATRIIRPSFEVLGLLEVVNTEQSKKDTRHDRQFHDCANSSFIFSF